MWELDCQVPEADRDSADMPNPIVDHNPNLAIGLSYRDYVEAHFLRLAYAEGLMTVIGAGWVTSGDLGDAPGEMLGRADYFHSANKERVVRLQRAICHLILNERSLVVRVAARDATDAESAMRRLTGALPEVKVSEREVPARFWWWAPNGPRSLSRMLPSPSWSEVQRNYVRRTRAQLEELSRWRGHPPNAGPLLLWHGEPGTGKTSAIRSLAREWRSWADFQFVTDPEEFLSNPGYLLATIAEPRGAHPAVASARWRIVVLEDAGEFLAPDAKRLEGQALSRLLNVCDGVLGQALRSLVLITTNEPLRHLHPALARPGRCLAEIGFELFDRQQAAAWCAGCEAHPPDGQRASLAELYAHVDGRPRARRKQAIGFARM
jgi:ATPase family associated with various cellular activities (AAA)/Domain of unknown function (DUF5925)